MSRSVPRLWLSFGVFCGLASLSKYTTVLLPAAVIFSLILSRKGRAHLRQPWIYLAAVIAVLIFSPVVWWNYRHQWASFLYQLHHGVSDEPAQAPVSGAAGVLHICRNMLLYLGGQAALWTPVLFVIGIVIMIQKIRTFFFLTEVDRVLLVCALLPLALFGAASAHKLGEVNWPSFAYVPLSLLTGRWIAEEDSDNSEAEPSSSPGTTRSQGTGPVLNYDGGAIQGKRRGRAHAVMEGCKLALIFTLVIHVLFVPGIPQLLSRLHVPLPHSARDLLVNDRHQYGRELLAAADSAPVVCNRHQDAAEASFYMPGQPDVWCDGVGSRPTAYDYFDVKPDFSTINRVLFVGGHAALFVAKHHYSKARMVSLAPAGTGHPRTAVMASR